MRRVASGAIIMGLALAGAVVTATAGAVQQKSAPAKGAAAGGKAAVTGKAIKNPVPSTPESIAAGAKIFGENCVDCHGKGAKGDGNSAPEGSTPANLTDAKWDHGSTDGEIYMTIKNGVGPKYDMDGFKESGLSDTDIWNVINFIRSIGPQNAKR